MPPQDFAAHDGQEGFQPGDVFLMQAGVGKTRVRCLPVQVQHQDGAVVVAIGDGLYNRQLVFVTGQFGWQHGGPPGLNF